MKLITVSCLTRPFAVVGITYVGHAQLAIVNVRLAVNSPQRNFTFLKAKIYLLKDD
jgi:hypothetical protein